MSTIFNYIILILAVWGVFHIEYKDKALIQYGKEYLASKNLTISNYDLSKFRTLLPSWSKSHYKMYIQKDTGEN